LRFFHLYIVLFFIAFQAFAQPAYIMKNDKKYLVSVDPKTYQVTFKAEDGTTYSGLPDLNAIDYSRVFDQSKLISGQSPAIQSSIAAQKTNLSNDTSAAGAVEEFSSMGEGSGILRLGKLSHQRIKIKPGIYEYINITSANHVRIDARGVILKGGKVDVEDGLNDVEFWGLRIEDQKLRAFEIMGFSNNVYLHDMEFENIGDIVINYQYHGIYDGTPASASKNFRLERLQAKNVGRFVNIDGGFKSEGIMNLMLNFKMSNCRIVDSPDLGSVLWIAAAQDFDIHHNYVNHVNYHFPDPNAPNGYHNGMWHVVGNGAFHDNIVTNHQGNAIRCWAVSYGSEMKTVRIYNNKVWNSRKYSAFEVQATPEIQEYLVKYPKRVRPVRTKVYNNTAGKLNVAGDWEGQLLDLYNTMGPVEYYRNLGFQLVRVGQATTDMINYNGSGTTMKIYGNVYQKSASQAVSDTVRFKSKFKGVGAP